MISLRWIPLLGLGCLAGVSCTAQKPKAPQPQAPQTVAPEAISPAKKLAPVAKKPAVKKGEVTEVLVEQVFGLRSSGQAFIIDTRPPLFFKLGHIDGAVNVPLKYFSKSYPANEAHIKQAVSDGKTLIVYCANETCVDSHKMAKNLSERGFDSSVFKGGWELWKETGLE